MILGPQHFVVARKEKKRKKRMSKKELKLKILFPVCC